MRKSYGFPMLLIASCCLIFICLGYVQLFRSVTAKVNDPGTAEFWQVRNLALTWRSPVADARQAFANGDYASFDVTSIVSRSDNRVAENQRWEAVETAPRGLQIRHASIGWQGWLGEPDQDRQRKTDHQKFLKVSGRFALKYNREMARLMNAR